MRDQFHAQHLAGEVAGFADGLSNLYAPAFAASASVYLRFHHNSACARVEELFGDRLSFVPGSRHRSAGHCDAILL
jgi:hypothetical protein